MILDNVYFPFLFSSYLLRRAYPPIFDFIKAQQMLI